MGGEWQGHVCDPAAGPPAGGAEADADGGEEREAVRHGAAVPAHPLPADAERALLHSAGRAAHVPARPGRRRYHLCGPLPQGGAPCLPRPPPLPSPWMCWSWYLAAYPPWPPGMCLPLHLCQPGWGRGQGRPRPHLLTCHSVIPSAPASQAPQPLLAPPASWASQATARALGLLLASFLHCPRPSMDTLLPSPRLLLGAVRCHAET